MKNLLIALSIVSLFLSCNNGSMSENQNGNGNKEPQYFTVTYHIEERHKQFVTGTPPVDEKKYTAGEEVTLLGKGTLEWNETSEWKGHVFVGWSFYIKISDDRYDLYEIYSPGKMLTVDKNIDLYAYWL